MFCAALHHGVARQRGQPDITRIVMTAAAAASLTLSVKGKLNISQHLDYKDISVWCGSSDI